MKTRERLSEHFVIEEFDCNDGTRVPKEYIPALKNLCRQILEPMRDEFGPCTVHSGYRTESWNNRVRGARLSFHRYEIRPPSQGVASDVSFARGSVADWKRKAEQLRRKKRNGNGGIGYYPQGGFIHFDTRDYPADWNGS